MDDPTRPDQPGDPQATAGAPADDGELALMAMLVSTPDLRTFLDGLARSTAASLGGAVSCGVTARQERSSMAVGSSDAVAGALEERQWVDGRGPCVEVMESGEQISIPDVLAEDRWGDFTAEALAHGVRSCLSLPMGVGGVVLGAMNLYAGVAHAFADPALRARAVGRAQHGGAAMGIALGQARDRELSDQLREAIVSRSVIDQAIGILMAQQRCSASAAFAILRSASQGRNRKLRDLAADLVTAVSRQAPEPGHFHIED